MILFGNQLIDPVYFICVIVLNKLACHNVNMKYYEINNFYIGQIKLNFRFSSPPAPPKMPQPHCFLFKFFVVKSVYNVYITPVCIKSCVVLFIAQEQVQNGKISARKVVLLKEKDDMPV